MRSRSDGLGVGNRWLFYRLVFLLSILSTGSTSMAQETGGGFFHLVLVGDTGHGESYQLKREKQGQTNVLRERGYDAPLSGLKPLLDGAHYIIANLETPVLNASDAATVPFPDKDYSHWTDAALALPALRRVGIDAVSLANNHALDYAEPGLIQTLDHLAQANLLAFGAGRDAKLAQSPLSILLPPTAAWSSIEVIGVFEYRTSYDSKYSFYAKEAKGGTYAINGDVLREQIARLKAKGKPPLVIVYPHWGKNYEWRSSDQVEWAAAIIDAGADLIVGHGAHMLQEIEVIRNRTVFHSLGNFAFLSDGRYERLKAPPYSLVMWLDVPLQSQVPQALSARLYPIVTDNRITDFCSRPVNEREFEDLKIALGARCQGWKASKDERGYHVSVPIKLDN